MKQIFLASLTAFVIMFHPGVACLRPEPGFLMGRVSGGWNRNLWQGLIFCVFCCSQRSACELL